ncbi:hypothetical protein M9458_027121, partial [Cirrhinus mrigala]
REYAKKTSLAGRLLTGGTGGSVRLPHPHPHPHPHPPCPPQRGPTNRITPTRATRRTATSSNRLETGSEE